MNARRHLKNSRKVGGLIKVNTEHEVCAAGLMDDGRHAGIRLVDACFGEWLAQRMVVGTIDLPFTVDAYTIQESERCKSRFLVRLK